jgi:hypothetical protein
MKHLPKDPALWRDAAREGSLHLAISSKPNRRIDSDEKIHF